MGAVTTDTNRLHPVEAASDELLGVFAGLQRRFAPLISERFAEPVRLTKDAEKGDEIVYAVGRGPAGVVVELHDAYGAGEPMPLVSFANHCPVIFDTFDPDALASVSSPTAP